ncbi:OmpA/MotB family protein [Carnobacterium jeotgali]|uniref:OmpA/MotB family protein n=1 Tax=Carnobacterium jeotgali TaxID=545534 RepID=UPI003C74F36A
MSRRNKKHEEEPENHERWLLSYADFITLLMIFFIIMYSMSEMDKSKYNELASAFSVEMGGGGTGILKGGNGTTDTETSVADKVVTEEQKQEEVKESIDAYIDTSELNDSVTTSIEERGLVLSFNDALFFDSGNAEIKVDQIEKFADIGELLNQPALKDSFIRVEGYTDSVPVSNPQYKSNWDLSALRASNVAQIIIKDSGIDPKRVSVVGYGEYRPKADNKTKEGRLENRRVDILILNSEYNDTEQTTQ